MAIRLRAWLPNVLLVGLGLAFALGLTEGLTRLFFPQPTGLSLQDPYGLPMHWPGLVRYLPQYGHTVSFNSAGMRDREHAEAREPGVFRILLLGDSFMEALQVPFDSSLPGLLETRLSRESGRRVEVLNAGVSGWGTDDELRYLTEYGVKYRPDLVVVAMTLHNDISDNLREQWHTVKDGTLVDQQVQPIPSFEYRVLRLKAYLSTRFQIYQLWRRVRQRSEIQQTGQQLTSHVMQLFRIPTSETIARGVNLTGMLLRQIQTVSGQFGARVVLVLLPIRNQLSDSLFAGMFQGANFPPAALDIDRPQRMITPVADSLGIPAIDLLPGFRAWTAYRPEPLYLEWDGHWNEAGHRLAAEEVTRGLMQAGVFSDP